MEIPSSISELFQISPFEKKRKVISVDVFERGDQPPIRVKTRPVLALDEETGTYRKRPVAPPQEPPTTFSVSGDEVGLDGFATLKDNLYESFDSVAQVSSKLSSLFGKRDQVLPNSITGRQMSLAYGDTVEFKDFGESDTPIQSLLDSEASSKEQAISYNIRGKQTPGERLMKQYSSSPLNSKKNKDTTPVAEKDLFTSDFRKSFNSAKDTFYSAFDGLNQSPTSKESTDTADVTNFHPPTKTSVNQDETVTALTPYLEDLQSRNPLKRLKAQAAIQRHERRQRRRIAQEEREEQIESIKQRFFDIIDGFQKLFAALVALPSKVEEVVESTQYSIEEAMIKAGETAGEVQSLPLKIQKAVQEARESILETQRQTQRSIQETKERTQNVIQTVQNLPQTVEATVEESQRKVQEATDNVRRAAKQLEDLTFEAKVVLGLEEAKPKPPPPPKSGEEIAKELAVKAAGTVASAAGNLAVEAGKGTVELGFTGAKMAFSALSSKVQKQLDEKKEQKNDEIIAKVSQVKESSNTSVKTPVSMAEVDPVLDVEVTNALRVAQEALASAEMEQREAEEENEDDDDLGDIKTIEINEAVKRARKAAARAKRDAAELESMLKERRIQWFLETIRNISCVRNIETTLPEKQGYYQQKMLQYILYV